MNASQDGGFGFLHSWSDDLDPNTRRAAPTGGAVIDLDGIYLPSGDAPAVAIRHSGAARAVAFAALTLAAAWVFRND